MRPLGVSEALIRQHSAPESFERGRDYYHRGAVVALARRGEVLQAEVEGSYPEPYRVQVTFDSGGVKAAVCSCPYDWGGWCKHVVAALLAALHDPESVEERPSVEALLADLSRESLQSLVLRLTERDANLADVIETEIAALAAGGGDKSQAPAPSGSRPRRTEVDLAGIRRQVRAALHSLDQMRPSEAYWQTAGIVSGVEQVLEQARSFIQAGEGRVALDILGAITDEYVRGWTDLDDSNGELGGFFDELGATWTEALLAADLDPKERRSWVQKLEAWSNEVSDYGIDEAFDAALGAAEHGWDQPWLQRVLRGEDEEGDLWEGEDLVFASALNRARLNVLERQGRFDEYLRLAKATEQRLAYATMLVRVGRVAEAVEFGCARLSQPTEAHTLAQRLREHGHVDEAVRVAEHGLGLEGGKAPLAVWLCELATALGQRDRALRAAVVAFKEQPSLTAYLRVQELAGDDWPERRAELLAILRRGRSFYPAGEVEVFLHEGLIDDAIAAVKGTHAYELIEKVVAAAAPSHPDWVIETARRQAESIMNSGKAQHYDSAIRWLRYVKSAHQNVGRQAEWKRYLDGLIATHGRKYKLRPMLEALAK
ncbi:MAG: SWIM zinc finger domain-containing protein [Chloroflexi bacterium]|nr:SWIM zinc finger domain-containing protein [Chloroflexota bacterium]